MVLAVLPMVELVEVGEGVLEISDHLDPSRLFSFRKSFMKHVLNVHFYEYKWYLLYSPWLNLSRSLRVS